MLLVKFKQDQDNTDTDFFKSVRGLHLLVKNTHETPEGVFYDGIFLSNGLPIEFLRASRFVIVAEGHPESIQQEINQAIAHDLERQSHE